MPGPAEALRSHWPEYLMEAAGLGLFMLSAGLCAAAIWLPNSPISAALPDPFAQRAVMGVAMGLTAIALIYSPWGQQSGAHFNPAVTLAFLRLRKIQPWDAVFYILAQTLGGIGGVVLAAAIVGPAFAAPPVAYIVTVPGEAGAAAAFLAEFAIAAGMMLMVLVSTGTPALSRFTGLFAGLLVALYIAFESPLSGMSLNPARTLASAAPGGIWTDFWVYLVAPALGMQAAIEIHRYVQRNVRVACAKLNHHTHRRCIFNCGHAEAEVASAILQPAR